MQPKINDENPAIKPGNDAMQLFVLLIWVKYKEVEHWDKAGNWKEDEIFTELIPCFISVCCSSTDFQQKKTGFATQTLPEDMSLHLLLLYDTHHFSLYVRLLEDHYLKKILTRSSQISQHLVRRELLFWFFKDPFVCTQNILLKLEQFWLFHMGDWF